MSRRIAFNVNDKVYAKLEQMFNSDDSDVNSVIKQFIYNTVEEPLEFSPAERRALESIARRKKEIAEKEARLTKERNVPANPFAKAQKPAPKPGLPKQ